MTDLNHSRLRDQVTDRLRAEILCGELPEDTPIREIPTAERFAVSRAPVRFAILQLTNEGLLEAAPHCGARVSKIWNDDLRAVMVDVRTQIETFALRKLMQDKDTTDLQPFRENLRHYELACRDNDLPGVVRIDMAFHGLILQKSGCPELESVWRPIMGGMRLPYARHKVLMESHAEHKRVLDAIKNGNIDAATKALKANIR